MLPAAAALLTCALGLCLAAANPAEVPTSRAALGGCALVALRAPQRMPVQLWWRKGLASHARRTAAAEMASSVAVAGPVPLPVQAGVARARLRRAHLQRVVLIFPAPLPVPMWGRVSRPMKWFCGGPAVGISISSTAPPLPGQTSARPRSAGVADAGLHSGDVSRPCGGGPAEERITWTAEGSHDDVVVLGVQPDLDQGYPWNQLIATDHMKPLSAVCTYLS
eukprot:jgi/Ulvmu1/11662/UM008_0068.1